MNSLTIAHLTIHQDEHGRYSLNDLYKASGGLPKNKPSEWMRNKQTKALIETLMNEQSKAGIPALPQPKVKREFPLRNSKTGREFPPAPVWIEPTKNPGTYVVKELVYAYAMWISPAFMLKVIRAYDALMRGETKAEQAKNLQAWREHLKKYPEDREIRDMARKGEPYWYIGKLVKLSAATVGKRIQRMIAWGFIDAQLFAIERSGRRGWFALRRKHFHQLSFW